MTRAHKAEPCSTVSRRKRGAGQPSCDVGRQGLGVLADTHDAARRCRGDVGVEPVRPHGSHKKR